MLVEVFVGTAAAINLQPRRQLGRDQIHDLLVGFAFLLFSRNMRLCEFG